MATTVSITWTCPGEACVATGPPPTRQNCLEKLFLKIEALTSVLDHAPERPATEADFALLTANDTLDLLLKHRKGLVQGMWAEPTDVCGCISAEEVLPNLNEAAR